MLSSKVRGQLNFDWHDQISGEPTSCSKMPWLASHTCEHTEVKLEVIAIGILCMFLWSAIDAQCHKFDTIFLGN